MKACFNASIVQPLSISGSCVKWNHTSMVSIFSPWIPATGSNFPEPTKISLSFLSNTPDLPQVQVSPEISNRPGLTAVPLSLNPPSSSQGPSLACFVPGHVWTLNRPLRGHQGGAGSCFRTVRGRKPSPNPHGWVNGRVLVVTTRSSAPPDQAKKTRLSSELSGTAVTRTGLCSDPAEGYKIRFVP